MVKLSPLAVLIAATIGTEVAGPLGAIAAIPVGGAVQLIIAEAIDARRRYREQCESDDEGERAAVAEGENSTAVARS
jgi:predicted PurR-regulated permease PerM